MLKDPHTVIPDEAVPDTGRVFTLGGTRVELTYHGLNHSDSTLVMRLPKQKLVFIVDTIPVGTVPGRGMIDFHPLEAKAFIKQVLALDWERFHPGPPGPARRPARHQEGRRGPACVAAGRLRGGQELGQEGKCWDVAEKEFRLAGYEKWPGYESGLPFIARRYCGRWGRGT